MHTSTPVPEAHGIEDGRLMNRGILALGRDLEFQPGPARQAHFGGQTQPVPRLDGLDAPEIHGIADLQVHWVPASPAQTDTTNQQIEPAT